MTREVVQIIDKETGDVNNLRDKKLADSTTQQQSGSASTDSVVMKTTGGDYVEIARDSFVGAIKSVMDGLIKGNSYTTLGANDPIAAFNSNALGGITPANLASVLGVSLPYSWTLNPGQSLDTYPNPGKGLAVTILGIDSDIYENFAIVRHSNFTSPKTLGTKTIPVYKNTSSYHCYIYNNKTTPLKILLNSPLDIAANVADIDPTSFPQI